MKIKINGKDHAIPASWKEVTFKQFLELSKAGTDTSKILSVFTGIDAEIIRTAKLKGIDSILSAISFLSTELSTDLPKKCLGFKIPENLEFETMGQFEDLKAEFTTFKQDIDSISRYVNVVAIYATDYEIGKPDDYNYKKAEKLASRFMDAPCEEVMAIGNFTGMKLIGLNLLIKPSTQNQSDTLVKKLRLALKAWLSRLVFTTRYYLWKRKLGIKETSLRNGQ